MNIMHRFGYPSIVFLLILSFVSLPLMAQDEEKKETEEEKAVGTYLDYYHAKETATRLKDRNRMELYRLKVMVANFGEDDQKSQLEQANKDYKDGIKYYYRKKYLVADKYLSKNKEDIYALYKALSTKYRERTNELLSRCADNLVEIELSESIELSAVEQSRTKTISKTRVHLVVAYNQLSMGEVEETSERYPEAISHYRVATYHAINMLIEMAETKEDKDKLREEFKVDLADVENRTAETAS